jgi:hypothetical protein
MLMTDAASHGNVHDAPYTMRRKCAPARFAVQGDPPKRVALGVVVAALRAASAVRSAAQAAQQVVKASALMPAPAIVVIATAAFMMDLCSSNRDGLPQLRAQMWRRSLQVHLWTIKWMR